MRPTVYLPRAAAAALLALAATASDAHAQRVATRADLATILGATARTETFDDVTDPARGVYAMSTHLPQPGPGLPLTNATDMPNARVGVVNARSFSWWPAAYTVLVLPK